MRFSVCAGLGWTWSEVLSIAAHCDESGWDGFYVADHLMPNAPAGAPAEAAIPECWSVLAALGACVPRLRLGSLVSSVTFRHPAVLAKIAATVDHISDGRVVLGIGAGWQENEHAAFGLRLGSPRERSDRLAEAAAAISCLLRTPRTTFAGEFFQLVDVPNPQRSTGHAIPLLVGGRGERRTMRVAAEFADEWNCWMTPGDARQKISVLRRHCETVGRDPAELMVSTQAVVRVASAASALEPFRGQAFPRATLVGTPPELRDAMEHYRAAGVGEFIVSGGSLGDSPGERRDTLDLLLSGVVEPCRDDV